MRAAAAFLLILGLVAATCAEEPAPPWQARLDAADQLIEQGYSERALRVMTDLLARARKRFGPGTPELLDTLTRLGELDYTLERFPQAAEEFQEVLKARPEAGLYFRLAQTEVRLGRLAQARKDFQTAKAGMSDEQINDVIEEGYEWFQEGQDAAAKQDFQDLAEFGAPEYSAQGYHHLGVYDFRHGRLAKAETEFRQALDIEESRKDIAPEVVLHTIVWLARTLLEIGGPAAGQAEEVLRRGLRISDAAIAVSAPWRVFLLAELARAEAAQGRGNEADFRRALEECGLEVHCPIDGRAVATVNLAAFLAERGKKGAAADAAARAWWNLEGSTQPMHDPTIMGELADVLEGLGQTDKALEIDRHLVALYPTWAIPAMARAQMRLADDGAAAGRLARAEELYRQAALAWTQDGPRKDAIAAWKGLAGVCEREHKTSEERQARQRFEALRSVP